VKKTTTHCNGCGRQLRDEDNKSYGLADVVIAGDRANGMCGGLVPDGHFDWCLTCAQIAFAAVKAARAPAEGWKEDKDIPRFGADPSDTA
jgi:hypothetical protein